MSNYTKNTSFVLIAGPCVIEDKKTTIRIAETLKRITKKLDIPFIFKASYDKANRTSIKSFRGVGVQKGLEILKDIKDKLNIRILTDVHSVQQVKTVSQIADVIQIPAFLCRQTDLLKAVGKTNKIINIKKGQFLSPEDIKYVIKKIESEGNKRIMITERGTSFGYNNLVVDFRSLSLMKKFGHSVLLDVSHSLQNKKVNRDDIASLARAGIAWGCDGIFIEVHPYPDKALCDSSTTFPLSEVERLLTDLKKIHNIRRK